MPNTGRQSNIRDRVLRVVLITLVVVLAVLLVLWPGLTELIYRADARVALSNARSLNTALRVTALTEYGSNNGFCDFTQEGGLTESAYSSALSLSHAPGTFQVLRVSEDGYTVESFVYFEGEFTVWYSGSDSSYTVYHEDTMLTETAGLEP